VNQWNNILYAVKVGGWVVMLLQGEVVLDAIIDDSGSRLEIQFHQNTSAIATCSRDVYQRPKEYPARKNSAARKPKKRMTISCSGVAEGLQKLLTLGLIDSENCW
jgi:hypothetical protein